jgi:DNA polymerase-3 subunit alpha (Gram-positive type)
VWGNNAEQLIESGRATLQEVPASREDIYDYLISRGMSSEDAFRIMKIVRRGEADERLSEKDFEGYDLPKWFYEFICKIEYIWPKAHAISSVKTAMRMAWFKRYHAECFNTIVVESSGSY